MAASEITSVGALPLPATGKQKTFALPGVVGAEAMALDSEPRHLPAGNTSVMWGPPLLFSCCCCCVAECRHLQHG